MEVIVKDETENLDEDQSEIKNETNESETRANSHKASVKSFKMIESLKKIGFSDVKGTSGASVSAKNTEKKQKPDKKCQS